MAKKSPKKASKKKSNGKKPTSKSAVAKPAVPAVTNKDTGKLVGAHADKVQAAIIKKAVKDVTKTANTVLKVAAIAAKHPDPKIKNLGGEVKKAGDSLKATVKQPAKPAVKKTEVKPAAKPTPKPAPKPAAKPAEAPKAKLATSQPKPAVKKDDKEKEEKMATHTGKVRSLLNKKIFGA